MHVLKEDLNKATLRFRESLNYTDTPAWKEVVDTMSNKDSLLDNMKERNARVSVDYLNANNKVNSQNITLQDYEKIRKILGDLEKENNNLRPKFQEMVLFKINAERKIHDLKEEMIRSEVEGGGNYSSTTSKKADEYRNRI